MSEQIGKEKKSLLTIDIFNRYASDNKEILSALGVIATICALFLNVDVEAFAAGLRELQLLLLLLFAFALIVAAVTTLAWVMNNADSFFGGLIGYTYILVGWKLVLFIAANFREELNEYLNHMTFSVMLVVIFFALDMQNKIEEYFKKFSIPKPLLFSLGTYFFLYTINVIMSLYIRYANNKPIDVTNFTSHLYNPVVIGMAGWVFIDTYYLSVYEKPKRWLVILIRFIFPPLVLIAYFLVPFLI